MKMQNTSLKTLVLTTCIACASATVTVAETPREQVKFIENSDGEVRVNIAGRLRMLSQRIPAAACNLNAGVDPAGSRAVLDSAIAEFDTILFALQYGDASLGVMSSETNLRTLRMIEDLRASYTQMDTTIRADADPALSDATIQYVADHNTEVLDQAKQIVTEISGQYSNPAALLQSDAMAIDIAGRQRMLTQMISKNICQSQSGINVEESHAALAEAVNLFEVSLNALRSGMVDVGIQPPPTEEISRGLEIVLFDWSMIRGHIMTALDGGHLDHDSRQEVLSGLDKALADMNAVVSLYVDHAHSDL